MRWRIGYRFESCGCAAALHRGLAQRETGWRVRLACGYGLNENDYGLEMATDLEMATVRNGYGVM